ncbi:hypothetical protein GBK02_05445 [Dechloromonas sp. TW-R-39-2]|uniref:hypothetical protein n=1 Tax=Dechloromonas sp. TW-R-39-2 TaxID=2654218 RepID=UPI00193E918C|nr:hypothetical protein [Dechloromonas sp. TW-R-39-2]QRM18874.1 hypothetical protein GBK02_05445 [Dechloromonas sp. TW-R-39-2]
MNRVILKIAFGIIVGMVIYPPYEMLGLMDANHVVQKGYAFIFDFPVCYNNPNNCGFTTRVDMVRLLLQTIFLVTIAVISGYAFRESK